MLHVFTCHVLLHFKLQIHFLSGQEVGDLDVRCVFLSRNMEPSSTGREAVDYHRLSIFLTHFISKYITVFLSFYKLSFHLKTSTLILLQQQLLCPVCVRVPPYTQTMLTNRIPEFHFAEDQVTFHGERFHSLSWCIN